MSLEKIFGIGRNIGISLALAASFYGCAPSNNNPPAENLSPTVSITNPVDGATYDTLPLTLEYTATDPEEDDLNCKISVNYEDMETVECNELVSLDNLNEGENSAIVYTEETDNLDNFDTAEVTFNYDSSSTQPNLPDTTPPVVNITNLEDGARFNYNQGPTSLESTTIDANLDFCEFSDDGGVTRTEVTCNEPVSNLTYNIGTNNWTVYGTDLAGNEGSDSVSFEVSPNQAPETTITKSFGDGLSGIVNYLVCGTDSDGYVSFTETSENLNDFLQHENTSQSNPHCISLDVTIVEGTNSLEARAYDNEGLRDPTIASVGFYSPTEEGARAVIDGILADRGYVEGVDYEKDKIYGADGILITSDYFFTRTDGTRVVINYGGHQDDLNTEINNYATLENAGIPQFTKIRVEIDGDELGSWLDNNIY